nr:beta-propeller domain-containing protein [Actinomycetota bacterium]
MTLGKRVAFLGTLAVLVAVALGGTTGSAAQTARAPRLAAFGSCGQLLAYAKSNARPLVGPYGLGSPLGRGGIAETARAAGSPVQGVDFSGTNVQEEGVDEPDIVKTNGNTLFAIANGKLNAVDVSDPKPRLLDTLALDPALSHELLLHGDRLLVLSRGGFWVEPLPAIAARMAPYQPSQSVLAEVNVADPKRLRLVRTLTLDGSYVAARLVGGSVRIVAASQVPGKLPFAQPKDGSKDEIAAAASRNRAVVASSRVASWLPTYRIQRGGAKAGKPRPLVQCRHVRRAAAFSGLGMLTVLTVDLGKGLEPVDSVAVMTDGRIVYASPESLYVATERWADRPSPDKPEQEQQGVSTAIHKFDISSP